MKPPFFQIFRSNQRHALNYPGVGRKNARTPFHQRCVQKTTCPNPSSPLSPGTCAKLLCQKTLAPRFAKDVCKKCLALAPWTPFHQGHVQRTTCPTPSDPVSPRTWAKASSAQTLEPRLVKTLASNLKNSKESIVVSDLHDIQKILEPCFVKDVSTLELQAKKSRK